MCKLSICNMIYHKYSPDAPLSIMLNGIYVNIMLKSEMFFGQNNGDFGQKKSGPPTYAFPAVSFSINLAN